MVSNLNQTGETDAAPKGDAASTHEGPAAETVKLEAPAETLEEARAKHAASVIRNNLYLSAAAGVIPVPYVDTAALIAVNLKMLKELADVYNVEFRAEIGKEAIGTLLASIAPPLLAGGILGSSLVSSVLRSLPWIGTAFGLVTLPAFHAAFSYALGCAFREHFASGGTFLTFNVEATKTYFREMYDSFRKRKAPAADIAAAEAPAAS
ncbi:MAG: DUF697 domain-containing protein [Ancalomicrobiaceae bacterium]|nr:DUF697 domain-containing protein [Ancalomicrobiaceae bacterium]